MALRYLVPIELGDDRARVPLIARDGTIRAWAVIDLQDVSLAQGRDWHLTAGGYARARRADVGYDLLHRLVCPSDQVTDHISGDRLDCRRKNLRPCTWQDNARNSCIRRHNQSGFKGVTMTQSGRFRAQIMVDRRVRRLGLYETAVAAALAYDAAAASYFGAFACPNFPSVSLASGPGVLAEAA